MHAQLWLMRSVGERRLGAALDAHSHPVHADLAPHLNALLADMGGRLDMLREAATEWNRSASERLSTLEHLLHELQTSVAMLASDEGGRGRAAHGRGETLDANIRDIQASLARLISEAGIPQDGGNVARHPVSMPEAETPDKGPLRRVWRRAVRPYFVMKRWSRTTESSDIVMLVVSFLRVDPRVERAARALVRAGWQVKVVAPDISVPPAVDVPIDWGENVEFYLLPFDVSNYVHSAPWLVSESMYSAAMAFKPFAFHCHDLTTALIGLRAARDTGARCLCDFHEWYSENVTWNDASSAWEPHDPQKRFLYRWAERHALQFADRVITVNQSIAQELDRLGRKPAGTVRIVRNIPPLAASPTRPYPPLKEQLGLPGDAFVVLYQGGTGPSRMLEPAIRALALAPKVTLVIRGPSLDLFGDHYSKIARESGIASRLVLAEPVTSRDVVAAARGADVGLWTLPNLSKNFYLALPNKIFEYLAAGLPLLVADFPEARRIATDLGVGLAFDPYDPASIAAQMNRFVEEPGFLVERRAAVPAALAALDAGREWDRLCDIYAELRAAHP